MAFVSAFMAAATLVLLPFVLVLAGSGVGGLFAIEAAPAWYILVASNLGISILALAAVAGFFVSSDRLAAGFSFFWGTHSVWSRVESWIEDRLRNHGERLVPLWATVAILAVLLIIVWV